MVNYPTNNKVSPSNARQTALCNHYLVTEYAVHYWAVSHPVWRILHRRSQNATKQSQTIPKNDPKSFPKISYKCFQSEKQVEIAILLKCIERGCLWWQYRLIVATVIHDCRNAAARHTYVKSSLFSPRTHISHILRKINLKAPSSWLIVIMEHLTLMLLEFLWCSWAEYLQRWTHRLIFSSTVCTVAPW